MTNPPAADQSEGLDLLLNAISGDHPPTPASVLPPPCILAAPASAAPPGPAAVDHHPGAYTPADGQEPQSSFQQEEEHPLSAEGPQQQQLENGLKRKRPDPSSAAPLDLHASRPHPSSLASSTRSPSSSAAFDPSSLPTSASGTSGTGLPSTYPSLYPFPYRQAPSASHPQPHPYHLEPTHEDPRAVDSSSASNFPAPSTAPSAQAHAPSGVKHRQRATEEDVRAVLQRVVSDSGPPSRGGGGGGGVVSVHGWYPEAAQKSYANEKRFLTPSPYVHLSLSSSPSSSFLASSSSAHDPTFVNPHRHGADDDDDDDDDLTVAYLALSTVFTPSPDHRLDPPTAGAAGGPGGGPSSEGSTSATLSEGAGRPTAAANSLHVQQVGEQQRKLVQLTVAESGSGASTSHNNNGGSDPGVDGRAGGGGRGSEEGRVGFDGVYVGLPTGVPEPSAAAAAAAREEVEGGGMDLEGPSIRIGPDPAEQAAHAVQTKARGKGGNKKGKQHPAGAGAGEWRLRLGVWLAPAGAGGRGGLVGMGGGQDEWERGTVRAKRAKVGSSSSTQPSSPPPSLTAPPLLSLLSTALSIRSKPPKRSKTGKHRPPTAQGSLRPGQTVFLYSRINKQTSRQASLAVLPGGGEPGEGEGQGSGQWRLGTSTEAEWSRWRIERVGSAASTNDDGSHPPAEADVEADADWIWYGDTVELVDVRTGVRTEPVVLCRLEGKSVVFDERAHASAAAAAAPGGQGGGGGGGGGRDGGGGGREGGRAGGTVGQLSKVAFRRPSPTTSYQGTFDDQRWYLSCAPGAAAAASAVGNGLGRGDGAGDAASSAAGGRQAAFVRPTPTSDGAAQQGRDIVDDFAIFTVGSVGEVSLTYFRLPPCPPPTLWPTPPPLPSIRPNSHPSLSPPSSGVTTHAILNLTLDNAWCPLPVETDGRPAPEGGAAAGWEMVEVWAGEVGPLECEVVPSSLSSSSSSSPFEVAGSTAVELAVGLPTAEVVRALLALPADHPVENAEDDGGGGGGNGLLALANQPYVGGTTTSATRDVDGAGSSSYIVPSPPPPPPPPPPQNDEAVTQAALRDLHDAAEVASSLIDPDLARDPPQPPPPPPPPGLTAEELAVQAQEAQSALVAQLLCQPHFAPPPNQTSYGHLHRHQPSLSVAGHQHATATQHLPYEPFHLPQHPLYPDQSSQQQQAINTPSPAQPSAIPQMVPPASTASAQPKRSVPLAFVRRAAGDGVLSGLSLTLGQNGALELVQS